VHPRPLTLAGLVVGLLLATACAPAAPPAAAPAAAPTSAAKSAAAPTGAVAPAVPTTATKPTTAAAPAPLAANRTLVVSNSFAFTTKDTDPARGGVDFAADPFFHAVYDTLLTFAVGDTTTPKPLVAESYTSSPDARTFTFTLRKDVKFSDGTPLRAGDVAFSYNRLLTCTTHPSTCWRVSPALARRTITPSS
jgi:peptide/nickel transport system substrate-binding protein